MAALTIMVSRRRHCPKNNKKAKTLPKMAVWGAEQLMYHNIFTRFKSMIFEYPLPTHSRLLTQPNVLVDILNSLKNELKITTFQLDAIVEMFLLYKESFESNKTMVNVGDLQVFKTSKLPPPTVFMIGVYEYVYATRLTELERGIYTLNKFVDHVSTLLTTRISPSQKHVFDATASKLGDSFIDMVTRTRNQIKKDRLFQKV